MTKAYMLNCASVKQLQLHKKHPSTIMSATLTRTKKLQVTKTRQVVVRMFGRNTMRAIPKISEETLETFTAISNPDNADRFSRKAALKAFQNVKI